MSRRVLAPIGIGGILLAAWLAPALLIAQAPAPAAKPASTTKWKVSRTPDGQPDLQGFWTNSTYTPLERSKDVNKEFFTPEELNAVIKKAAANEAEQTEPGTIADVHYDFTQFGLDRSQGKLAMTFRTSQIGRAHV